MTDGPTQTPMSDHVERFWNLLATEHVRILVDIRRDHDEGQPPHWDSSSFSNEVAKAIVEQHELSTAAERERCAKIVDQFGEFDGPESVKMIRSMCAHTIAEKIRGTTSLPSHVSKTTENAGD